MNNRIHFRYPKLMPQEFRTAEEEAENLAREMYVPNPLLKDEEFCYDWVSTVWWANRIGEDPKIKLKPLLSKRRKQYLPTVQYNDDLLPME